MTDSNNETKNKPLKGTKPSIPQGTRDFGPEVVRKRNFIFSTIRSVFELYGFEPLETPAFENLDTLMGKYGEEGDKLIFKILNNGLDNPAKHVQAIESFQKILGGKSTKDITERALKYDLTIPFARYVAMNHTQLVFPFKRYQVQPVWRADRPQRGRYREFYQCDADVVGSNSLLNEVEFINIYNEVFKRLGIKGYQLKINSRHILTALAEVVGLPGKVVDITIAIDKLDKIGIEKVKEELTTKGLNDNQVQVIEGYLSITGSNENKLKELKELLINSPSAEKGLAELNYVLETPGSNAAGTDSNLIIDFTLARGLNYYTGIIFEAKAPEEVKIGSIGGGGRYDDLTGLFGLPNIPGVGISFGVDRIYDVMEELNLFSDTIEQGSKALFLNLGTEEAKVSYSLLQQLRAKNIPSEVYHELAKIDKQFKYAERKKIPYVVIIGSQEVEEEKCKVKNIRTGQQSSVAFSNLAEFSFI